MVLKEIGPESVDRIQLAEDKSRWWDLVKTTMKKDNPFWNIAPPLMMEVAGASETSVNVYQTTQRSIPEDGHIHVMSSKSEISRQ
jgi:transcription elongation factor GreA-like protein